MRQLLAFLSLVGAIQAAPITGYIQIERPDAANFIVFSGSITAADGSFAITSGCAIFGGRQIDTASVPFPPAQTNATCHTSGQVNGESYDTLRAYPVNLNMIVNAGRFSLQDTVITMRYLSGQNWTDLPAFSISGNGALITTETTARFNFDDGPPPLGIVHTPEPSTAVVVMLGFVVLVFYRVRALLISV